MMCAGAGSVADFWGTKPVDRAAYHWAMGKILKAINNWFIMQNLRHDMAHHCPHQPVGSCSEECAQDALADRW